MNKKANTKTITKGYKKLTCPVCKSNQPYITHYDNNPKDSNHDTIATSYFGLYINEKGYIKYKDSADMTWSNWVFDNTANDDPKPNQTLLLCSNCNLCNLMNYDLIIHEVIINEYFEE